MSVAKQHFSHSGKRVAQQHANPYPYGGRVSDV